MTATDSKSLGQQTRHTSYRAPDHGSARPSSRQGHLLPPVEPTSPSMDTVTCRGQVCRAAALTPRTLRNVGENRLLSSGWPQLRSETKWVRDSDAPRTPARRCGPPWGTDALRDLVRTEALLPDRSRALGLLACPRHASVPVAEVTTLPGRRPNPRRGPRTRGTLRVEHTAPRPRGRGTARPRCAFALWTRHGTDRTPPGLRDPPQSRRRTRSFHFSRTWQFSSVKEQSDTSFYGEPSRRPLASRRPARHVAVSMLRRLAGSP